MEALLAKSQYVSVEDIRNNPGLIAQLILKEQDVSVIFQKKGDNVKYSYLKTYDKGLKNRHVSKDLRLRRIQKIRNKNNLPYLTDAELNIAKNEGRL